MSANGYRYANNYARLHESVDYLNSTKHFKRLADEGYIDLDEPKQTCSSIQSGIEYDRWIHDAWNDFVNKMQRAASRRPVIKLGNDLQAYCSTHLSGSYYGKTMCTNTFLTFRYIKLVGPEHVYQWKVTLDPVHFMQTQSGPELSATWRCSCILKCCCIQRHKNNKM